MSNRITSLCRPLRMSPTQKAVLMCLADRASDDGVAWPSITGICEWTCLGRTAAMDAVRWLEGAGFVAVERRHGRKNRATLSIPTIEAANQSATRTSSAGGLVREADPTSPPGGPEASEAPGVHQGSTPTPAGGGLARPPADAGRLNPPEIGDLRLWAKLAELRRDAAANWSRWVLQAREHYPTGGPALDDALRELIGNSHWRDLPARTHFKAGRTSQAVYDYGKGFS